MSPRSPRWALVGLLLVAGPASAQEAKPGAEWFQRAEAALAAGEAWKARGLFERAIFEGYPKVPGYRALADAWLALDHRLLDARAALERALDHDPSRIEDWMLLADINLRLGGMDMENRARAALREVMRRDPTHGGAYARWRRLYLDRKDARRVDAIFRAHLDRAYDPVVAFFRIDLLTDLQAYDEALEELARLEREVDLAPYRGRWSYYRGVALTGMERDEEGWDAYREGIAEATSEDDLERFFVDLEPLLTDGEKEAWPDLSLEKRKRFLLGWWNRRDPLPLTGVNERWVEQQRRMRFVLDTFPFRKPIALERVTDLDGGGLGLATLALRVDGRALDDRAELYLRHGAPDMTAGVGDDECGYWYYRRKGLPGGSFAVNFRRPDLLSIGSADFAGSPLFRTNDCVFWLTPTTAMGRGHFAPGMGPIRPWDIPRIQEDVGRHLGLAMSTESFPYREDDRIPIQVDPGVFAGVEGLTELVVYFGVPLVAEDRLRYRKGLVLYDADWNEVTRRTEEMAYALAGDPVGTGDEPQVVDLFRVWLEPGTYRAAIQLDQRDGEHLGVWVGTVVVDDPAASPPGVSDLVLAADVRAVGPARFERYGHVIHALPSRAFTRDQPLHLYYEIYGLGTEADGRARFRVDYTLRADELDRGALERVFGALKGVVGIRQEPDGLTFSFERSGPPPEGGTWAERLSFDTRELAAGSYTLEVEITDHARGDRTARRAETFAIVE